VRIPKATTEVLLDGAARGSGRTRAPARSATAAPTYSIGRHAWPSLCALWTERGRREGKIAGIRRHHGAEPSPAAAPRVGPEKEGGKNGIRVQGEEAGRRVFCSCEDDGRPSIGIGRPGAVGS